MRVKYNRTSTINQEGKRFDLDNGNYDLVLFDKGVSGKLKLSERIKGGELLRLVKEGKVKEIVVEELSRLGRNTIDVLTNLQMFDEKEINVVVMSMGNFCSRPDGKKNPMWNMITSVMSSIYELERESILERTAMGRKVYVMNGGRLGRPEKSNESVMRFMNKPKNIEILKLIRKERTYKEIKMITGCSESTISKVRKYSGEFNKLKKKSVSPDQLDLVIESEKAASREEHLEQIRKRKLELEKLDKQTIKRIPPQRHTEEIREDIKEMEVIDEEIIFTLQERENIELMKMVNDRNKG